MILIYSASHSTFSCYTSSPRFQQWICEKLAIKVSDQPIFSEESDQTVLQSLLSSHAPAAAWIIQREDQSVHAQSRAPLLPAADEVDERPSLDDSATDSPAEPASSSRATSQVLGMVLRPQPAHTAIVPAQYATSFLLLTGALVASPLPLLQAMLQGVAIPSLGDDGDAAKPAGGGSSQQAHSAVLARAKALDDSIHRAMCAAPVALMHTAPPEELGNYTQELAADSEPRLADAMQAAGLEPSDDAAKARYVGMLLNAMSGWAQAASDLQAAVLSPHRAASEATPEWDAQFAALPVHERAVQRFTAWWDAARAQLHDLQAALNSRAVATAEALLREAGHVRAANARVLWGGQLAGVADLLVTCEAFQRDSKLRAFAQAGHDFSELRAACDAYRDYFRAAVHASHRATLQVWQTGSEMVAHDLTAAVAAGLGLQAGAGGTPVQALVNKVVGAREVLAAWRSASRRVQFAVQQGERELRVPADAQTVRDMWEAWPRLLYERLKQLQLHLERHVQMQAGVQAASQLSALAAQHGVDLPAQACANAAEELRAALGALVGPAALDISEAGHTAWAGTAQAHSAAGKAVDAHMRELCVDALRALPDGSAKIGAFRAMQPMLARADVAAAVADIQVSTLDGLTTRAKRLAGALARDWQPGANPVQQLGLPGASPSISALMWLAATRAQATALQQAARDVAGASWSTVGAGQHLSDVLEAIFQRTASEPVLQAWASAARAASKAVAGGALLTICGGAAAPALAVAVPPALFSLGEQAAALAGMGLPVPLTVGKAVRVCSDVLPGAVALTWALRTVSQALAKVPTAALSLLHASLHAWRSSVLLLWQQDCAWGSPSAERAVAKLSAAADRLDRSAASAAEAAAAAHAWLVRAGELPWTSAAHTQWSADGQAVARAARDAQLSGVNAWWYAVAASAAKRVAARAMCALVAWQAWMESGETLPADRVLQLAAEHSDQAALVSAAHQLPALTLQADARRSPVHAPMLDLDAEDLSLACELQVLEDRVKLAPSLGSLMQRALRTVHTLCLPAAVRLLAQGDHSAPAPLALVPHSAVAAAALGAQQVVAKLATQVRQWQHFSQLWITPLEETLPDRLGHDLVAWQRLLASFQTSKAAADRASATGDVVQVGALRMDARPVRSALSSRLTALVARLLPHAQRAMQTQAAALLNQLDTGRYDLEQPFRAADPEAAAACVNKVHQVHEQIEPWGDAVRAYVALETFLRSRRAADGPGWMDSGMLEAALARVHQQLQRQEAVIDEHASKLELSLTKLEEELSSQASAIRYDWETSSPRNDASSPDAALAVLADLASRCSAVNTRWEKLVQARRTLGLQGAGASPVASTLLDVQDLMDVWRAVQGVHAQWASATEVLLPRVDLAATGATLARLTDTVKDWSAKLQQYTPVQRLAASLEQGMSEMRVAAQLLSDSMQGKHLQAALRALGLRTPAADTTLGALLGAGLSAHASALAPVFEAAAGEAALRKYLQDLDGAWLDMRVQVAATAASVSYVSNWEAVLSLVDEHAAGLHSMRNSPYFHVFAEQAQTWTRSLFQLRVVAEQWREVQRKHLHLAGLFGVGSGVAGSQLRAQLPREWSQFSGVHQELSTLLAHVAQHEQAMDVLGLPNIATVLERLAHTLDKVQRHLGAWLETQRSASVRLYFLGDDDLLEVLGGSTFAALQPHISKLLPGASKLLLGEGGQWRGLQAASGEQLLFSEPVAADTPIDEAVAAAAAASTAAVRAAYAQDAPQGWQVLESDDTQAVALWTEGTLGQAASLGLAVWWTARMAAALGTAEARGAAFQRILASLRAVLASATLQHSEGQGVHGADGLARRRLERVVTAAVHLRDVTLTVQAAVGSLPATEALTCFDWLCTLRTYDAAVAGEQQQQQQQQALLRLEDGAGPAQVDVVAGAAAHAYGWEWQGTPEPLVVTPLTARCYLTLLSALHHGYGGAPFGPAGTGKTESVKALGGELGRLVLVFCCDESFDAGAIGRIFGGLCRVGAWGCFDEMNRLAPAVLSVVAGQLSVIQASLAQHETETVLQDVVVPLHAHAGVFVTMNPGYAGRSELPDNLTALFRPVAMTRPDRVAIAQVILFSQGFQSAEALAQQVISLFTLCSDQLSAQAHYDFGLRALKQVLGVAGQLRRAQRAALDALPDQEVALAEVRLLLRAVDDATRPKLVTTDVPIFAMLLHSTFAAGDAELAAGVQEFRAAVAAAAEEAGMAAPPAWLEKVQQLGAVASLRHGLAVVGPARCGKSSAWRLALRAATSLDGVPRKATVIDPRALPREGLLGMLDPASGEWHDGVLTAALRKLASEPAVQPGAGAEPAPGNAWASSMGTHWIVLDGVVEPDWAEALNSVLDDNKLLTLPSGERLALPAHGRILFECDSVSAATPATVSRLGMVWMPTGVLPLATCVQRWWSLFQQQPSSALARWTLPAELPQAKAAARESNAALNSRDVLDRARAWAEVLAPWTEGEHSVLASALRARHAVAAQAAIPVVDTAVFAEIAAVVSFYVAQEADVAAIAMGSPGDAAAGLSGSAELDYAKRVFLWATAAACTLDLPPRAAASVYSAVRAAAPAAMPALEAEAWAGCLPSRAAPGWVAASSMVPTVHLTAAAALSPHTVVQTGDVLQRSALLRALLASTSCVTLVGPPGSGKTMALTSALSNQAASQLQIVSFSSGTTVAQLLSTIAPAVQFVRAADGALVMEPIDADAELVVFCDEVNLPAVDAYGVSEVVAWLRCVQNLGGFWRPVRGWRGLHMPAAMASAASVGDAAGAGVWVRVERVRWIAACNPPTDAGRHELPARWTAQCAVAWVDMPSEQALCHIYGTMLQGVLSGTAMSPIATQLAAACVQVFASNRAKFTTEQASHYVYSPRELSRWVRAIGACVCGGQSGPSAPLGASDLLLLWAHEGARLFCDRLCTAPEQEQAWGMILSAAQQHLAGCADLTADSISLALTTPPLFVNWVTGQYERVSEQEVRQLLALRGQAWAEDHGQAAPVITPGWLQHCARLARVLLQPVGHALLIGASGSGKATAARFAAWLAGFSVHTPGFHSGYTLADFDEDLRSALHEAGVAGQGVVLLIGEGMPLSTGFLERMNGLLASGDVPNLYDAEAQSALNAALRKAATAAGAASVADDEAELAAWFTARVRSNLHCVFTLDPNDTDLGSTAASSPALFNRCVLDWYQRWDALELAALSVPVLSQLDTRVDTAGEFAWAPALAQDSPASIATAAAAWWRCSTQDPGALFTGVAVPQHAWRSHVEHILPAAGPSDALAAALAVIHAEARHITDTAARASDVRAWVTPRHFVRFVQTTAELLAQRSQRVDEATARVAAGLQQLQSAQAEVAELRASMSHKQAELHTKNQAATAKLEEVTANQAAAEIEQKHVASLGQQLDEQRAQVAARQEEVAAALSETQPALEAARAQVESIRRADIDELKSMAKPPAMVRVTMEAVMAVLDSDSSGSGSSSSKPATRGSAAASSDKSDWAAIRRRFMQSDFLSSVVNYDSDAMTAALRGKLQRDFFSQADFNKERVTASSKACGRLFEWLDSQMKYAAVLERIAPLRAESAKLEAEADQLAEDMASAAAREAAAREVITQSRAAYERLVVESDAMRKELERLEKATTQAGALVDSLGGEQSRWAAQVDAAQDTARLVCGNAVLAAVVCVYAGPLDLAARRELYAAASRVLEELCLRAGEDIPAICAEFMPAGVAAQWAAVGLPQDDEVAVDNAAAMSMLAGGPPPLLIDPTSTAHVWLREFMQGKRAMTSVSLRAANLTRALESAVRFGGLLVVEGVHHAHPDLVSVLNGPKTRVGGVPAVRVGSSMVPLSPQFQLLLLSTNAADQLPPRFLARVSCLSFAPTASALREAAVTRALSALLPELAQRRAAARAARGELAHELQQLEDGLLAKLSSATDNILADETLLSQLVDIQARSASIQARAAETGRVLEQVATASSALQVWGTAVTELHEVQANAPVLHAAYRNSLSELWSCVDSTLKVQQPVSDVDALRKLAPHLAATLARAVLKDALLGGLQVHSVPITLAMLCAVADCVADVELPSVEVSWLSQASPAAQAQPVHEAAAQQVLGGLNCEAPASISAASARLASLCSLPGQAWQALAGRLEDPAALDALATGLQAPDQLLQLEGQWAEVLRAGLQAEDPALLPTWRAVLLCSAMAPWLLETWVDELTSCVLRSSVDDILGDGSVLAWLRAVSAPHAARVLLAPRGNNPMQALRELSQKQGRGVPRVLEHAMGTPAAAAAAVASLEQQARTSSWLVLSNAHLAPDTCTLLLDRLQRSADVHPEFRLVLTAPITDGCPAALPLGLLQACPRYIIEPHVGLRAATYRALAALPSSTWTCSLVEARRVHALTAWSYAGMLERRRYVPLGWAAPYDWSDADLIAAAVHAGAWLQLAHAIQRDPLARPKPGPHAAPDAEVHIDPSCIPWDSIATLLATVVFGGRVAAAGDTAALKLQVAAALHAGAYQDAGHVAPCDPSVQRIAPPPPAAVALPDFKAWAHALPQHAPPEVLGLPARTRLATTEARMLQCLAQFGTVRQQSLALAAGGATPVAGAGLGSKALDLAEVCSQVSELSTAAGGLAQALGWDEPSSEASVLQSAAGDRACQAEVSPTEAWLHSELRLLTCRLQLALQDLESAVAGAAKPALANVLALGRCPSTWASSTAAAAAAAPGLAGWVEASRAWLTQLQACSTPVQTWAGVYLRDVAQPAALLSAFAQTAALESGVPVHDLQCQALYAGQESPSASARLTLQRVVLDGAGCNEAGQLVDEDTSVAARHLRLVWAQRSALGQAMSVPLFSSAARQQQIGAVQFEVASDSAARAAVLRRACLFCM